MNENPLLEHFDAPYHRGDLLSATHRQSVSSAACGDEVTLAVQIENQRIEAAWFQASGCIVCQAAASMLCEHIEHRTLTELADFRGAAMLDLTGIPLTPGRQPCGLLALQAFREILDADSALVNLEQHHRHCP